MLDQGYLRFWFNSLEAMHPFSDCKNNHMPTCIKPNVNCVAMIGNAFCIYVHLQSVDFL